jgi:hypothetical protein
MADKKQDYSFAGGLSNINPAEVPVEDIDKYRSVTEQGIKALEERYRNPNWFKVAAGFAKPQLGGFLASLGSAAEALGENVEQQRENILPVTQMKQELELSKIYANQKNLQNKLYQEWKDSGRPMDERTLGRITTLGSDTEVAKAAQRYWDDTKKRLEATGTAEELASKFPRLEEGFKNFINLAADPTADPEVVKKRQADYDATLASAKPPQTDAATWNGMSREQKQDAVFKYQEAQQKIGLTKEGEFKLAHDQALPRLATMGTIRDLALGKGLPDITVKDKDGKPMTLNGQQQMDRLLGMFGGDNPVEVIAKAISEGRLGDIFKGADTLVRQLYMNPESRRAFEQLSKLLARQNVEFRNSAVNPTNAYQELQNAGSANVANSQKALIGIMDMMAHSERNHVGNYLYVLNKGPDARRIGADPEFYERQRKHAEEYSRIAVGPQTYNRPWYYTSNEAPRGEERTTPRTEAAPAAPAVTEPSAAAPAIPNTSQANTPAPNVRSPNTQPRRNTVVGTNGNIFRRDANGRWVDTGEKP